MSNQNWSIDIAQTYAVLNSVDTQTQDFDTSVGDIMQAIADAAIAAQPPSGTSETASALGMIGTDPIGADAASTVAFIAASVTATRNAILQYEHGDLTMAADFENSMKFDNE
jgi:Family of unknown function (DUF6507)